MQNFIDNDLNIANIGYMYEIYRDEPWFFQAPHQTELTSETTMYSINFLSEGSMTVSYGKEETIAKAPCITLSKIVHKMYKSRGLELPTRHLTINFFTDKKIEFLENVGNILRLTPSEPLETEKLFTKIFEIYNQDPLGSKLEQKGLLMQILSKVKNDFLNQNINDKLPKEFIEAIAKAEINAHENVPIDIKKLAKECNLSYEYFIRIFKKHTGTSPKQYFNKIKLNYCASMLRYSGFGIEEIAEMTGYNTLPYFFRSFKNQFGISPMKYRQLYNKQEI